MASEMTHQLKIAIGAALSGSFSSVMSDSTSKISKIGTAIKGMEKQSVLSVGTVDRLKSRYNSFLGSMDKQQAIIQKRAFYRSQLYTFPIIFSQTKTFTYKLKKCYYVARLINDELHMLNNKTVLITGGTGSFGKKFASIILNKFPNIRKIIIYSRDEYKQFLLQNSPEFKPYLKKMRFFVGDVRDKERLMMAFQGVDVVIHAAALKQVPTCEYNPFEAIKTNVLGAQNVIEAAIGNAVSNVVGLSTDKACAPVNLYGATKLCADKLFIAGNAYSGSADTKFAVVRYGNVAGSRGSVIPFFQRLVKEGASELPITDFRMTRFWLKLEEAVEMVLTAIERMHGGELYVRKIPSMKITDLAMAIAPNIKLLETGIRPGEKVHEQMITKEDARNTLEFKDYFVLLPAIDCGSNGHSYSNCSPVADNFEYSSDNNSQWLTIDEMRKMVEEIE
jgi:UDP-N-acetylglucosamine 4,6-dehydratase (inverting)